MAKSRQLINILTRHQVLLEKVKTYEARQLAAVFDKVETGLRAAVLALETDTIDKLTTKQLRALVVDIQARAETALSRANAGLFDSMEDISAAELEFDAKAIKSLSAQIIMDMPTAKAVYAQAIARPMSATGDLITQFVDNWSNREIQRTTNAVQRAWAEGWTNQKLIQAVRGTKALNYKDGIVATSKRNAETVARTSIQHIANSGRLSLYEENNDVIDKYSILATLDGRTTQICRSLDGEKYEFGKGPVPPLHPNCRSTILPELSAEWAFLTKGETRASMDGPVDGDLTYYEWLKTQPESFQNEALGPSRGKLFRDGGLNADEFARLNLNRNFEPLTLEEMKAKEPLVFERAGLN